MEVSCSNTLLINDASEDLTKLQTPFCAKSACGGGRSGSVHAKHESEMDPTLHVWLRCGKSGGQRDGLVVLDEQRGRRVPGKLDKSAGVLVSVPR